MGWEGSGRKRLKTGLIEWIISRKRKERLRIYTERYDMVSIHLQNRNWTYKKKYLRVEKGNKKSFKEK